MDIVFVAGFAHPPNEDAACWFMREVLGKVRLKHPGATLSIVGSQPTARVRSLAGNGVTVLADVDDAKLLEVYRRARVAVVPLRWGAGVKLKVVEALREGVPLVTTPVGAQGLPGVCDVAFVRDTAESFARAVCELLSDDTVWKRCCAKQIEYAVARFNKSALQESIMNAL
ncbi:MAG: glycosyltransferase, partial [Acetobacteraceae bacterium]|nr:glycosyltransferase [Acetobacteraceae bacterium]